MSPRTAPEIRALLTDLSSARAAFVAAMADVEPALLEAPGLVGEWSGKQLLGHLAYWAEHAAGALGAAARGTLDEFDEPDLEVEERNAALAAEAAGRPLGELRASEVAAYEQLHEALERAEPGWLDESTAYGDTLAQVLRDDGSDHYREHTLDLRAWFTAGGDEPDETRE